MEVNFAVVTNEGNRIINEDSVGVFRRVDDYCFVLCDGLGGHGMGDIASGITVDVFENLFAEGNDAVSFLNKAFTAAQDVLLAKQIEKNARKKMKTTAVALVTDRKKVHIGHIGDSRAYVFRKNKVKFQTFDHSIPQMLVWSKEISQQEIRNHPDRNMLLRVLGTEHEEAAYELHKPFSIKKGQAFLLCSDGFWELIDESRMCQLLESSESVDEWLDLMTAEVIKNGEGRDMDNYSAIAVWCG